ncbi:MAG: 2-oxoacid:acceptor oxidoreductase subunit alpha [Candidatus Jordarchaeum sp.]|uniref:2-oxoacid:acceptor oxidoreductase subunit alpha n=1 Tax=Candidatus Jordarchaeum sp. TaxID=2823881 RepID=UPI004048EFEB
MLLPGNVGERLDFLEGNVACAEGALAAGCKFFAFYPITPAREIGQVMASKMPKVGGISIQMEDEIASISSVIGASWAGLKSMTATSGPGFSLMQESIGYAVQTETPCVIVDVQRGGPGVGQVGVPLQGDVIQSRHGAHGEYPIVVLAPSSPQDMFDYTFEAFNLSEALRTPVILLTDAYVSFMRESVVIRSEEDIRITNRKKPEKSGETSFFLSEDVAPMPAFGTGYRVHVTGSCHDERGYRKISDPEDLDHLIRRIYRKFEKRLNEIVRLQMFQVEDAKIVLLTYGSPVRSALWALKKAREEGIMLGCVRLVSIWPFAKQEIAKIAEQVDKIIVLENNMGQILDYVRSAACGMAEIRFLPPQILGRVHNPKHVLEVIRREASL